MSIERDKPSLSELLHANGDLIIRREVTGNLTAFKSTGNIEMSISAIFESPWDHVLYVSARRQPPGQTELAQRNYLKIAVARGESSAEYHQVSSEHAPISIEELLIMAKTVTAMFHEYQGLPEGEKMRLVHKISDGMGANSENVNAFNKAVLKGQPDYSQSQAEYAYQVLHSPLPIIETI